MHLIPGLKIVSELESLSFRNIGYQTVRSVQNMMMFPESRTFRFPGFLTPGHFPLLHSLYRSKTNSASRRHTPSPNVMHLHSMGLGRNWEKYCRMRESGEISRLTVGPLFFPDESNLGDYPADVFLVPSKWVADAVSSHSILARIKIWMAGVDTEFWRPNTFDQATRHCGLLYVKSSVNTAREICNKITSIKDIKWQVIRYGSYSQRQLLENLQRSSFVVIVGGSESQGLAHFQAWSTNRPTFVYDPKESMVIRTRCQSLLLEPSRFSRSPYLTESTGAFWSDLDELVNLLRSRELAGYQPRKWILSQASLESSFSAFLEAIGFRS